MTKAPVACVISLGCDKNRVDSETALYYLRQFGCDLTENVEEADIALINTCAFIDAAKRESIDTILDVVSLKSTKDLFVIVSGCMPARYKELAAELPEVDAFIGIDEYARLGELLSTKFNGGKTTCGVPFEGRILTTGVYSYLKIADGCNNRCTYCAIPMIRGRYRSRTIESLVDETKELIDLYDVKELNLVAQDVTAYGTDIYGKPKLLELLDRLQNTDIESIRLLYCYPELVGDDLIKVVAEDNKICKYLDIPLQHIDDTMLKRMGRRSREADIRRLIDKIKATESIALRSTFIAGFAGEGEEEFNKLYDFVKQTEFNYAGFFAYSTEENTPAAKLKNQLPQRVRVKRATELSKLQSSITEAKQKALVGKTLAVRYEGIDYNKQRFFGRTEFNAPDVDTKVFFTSNGLVEIGNIYGVTVTGTQKLDLIGEVK